MMSVPPTLGRGGPGGTVGAPGGAHCCGGGGGAHWPAGGATGAPYAGAPYGAGAPYCGGAHIAAFTITCFLVLRSAMYKNKAPMSPVTKQMMAHSSGEPPHGPLPY